ncbi:MAG: FAD-binding oxidoreductase [Ignavibacteria bacterium]|jgi:FAD/FMN-containing dehydrogenase
MINEKILGQFRKNLKGQLISSKDNDYEEARKVWNGMIDKHPLCIVRCNDEKDVVQAINFARSNNLEIATRGGGHNVAGFSTCDEGIVIDLSPMKKIEVDKASNKVRAQAGLTWGEFDKATQEQGLATTGGLVSSTGVAGFTLGGGFGWLVRKYGMTVDNLLSVEMILADGKRVSANSNENSDLYWAVRGGGGNFGIVTSFTFEVHPVGPLVYGGALFYPVSKAKEILHLYNKWILTIPDDLSTMVALLSAPPEHFVPKELVGTQMIVIALCYLGEKEEGDKLIKPLRDLSPAIDLAGPIPYVALQRMFDATAPKGIHAYWRTHHLRELSDNIIHSIVEQSSLLKSLSPFSAVHIHHWEGAVSRVKDEETAFSHRTARFVMNIIGLWMPEDNTEKHISWVRRFFDAIKQFATGQAYLNFLADLGEDKVIAAYGKNKYEKLAELKNKYDPENLFHLNQNIKPSV